RSERVSRLQILLEQAGLSMRAGNLLIVCLLSAAAGAAAGYVLAQPLPAQETLLFTGTGVGLGMIVPYSYVTWRRSRRFQKFESTFPVTLLFTGTGVGLGMIVPYSYVTWRRSRRFQKFESTFPEAIDTLARAVRAGHAFTVALEIVCNELTDPAASEFRKLYEEQKYGMPVRDALLNLSERMPL